MKRREFIAGAATIVATGALAQTTTISGNSHLSPQSTCEQPTEVELAAAYAICRQRGHVATAWGNGHPFITSDAVWRVVPDRPLTGYKERTETSWEQCFYCKKQFRFVTVQEEK